MKDITSRFLEVYNYLLESKKITNASDFAKKIGISTSLMSEIGEGRSNAGLKTLQKTVIEFPEINTKWLITGTEKMLSTEENKTDSEIFKEMIALQDKYIKKLEEEINSLKEEFRSERHSHRSADEKHKL